MDLILVGAYGRKTSLADWHKGKDFMIYNSTGTYCSIRDLDQMIKDGWTHVVLMPNVRDMFAEAPTRMDILALKNLEADRVET